MFNKKNPQEVFKKLGEAENILLMAKKEFLAIIDQALDAYNEKEITQEMRDSLIIRSQKQLEEVEKSLAEIQSLKRQSLNR